MKDILSDSQFKAMYPLLTQKQRELYLPYLNLAMAQFDIRSERRVSMFNAHLEHESTGLTVFFENLNYSARRLMQVWPKRFPTFAIASEYDHNPEKLANKTYGGRLGNLNVGDGWKYRGQGAIQLTGKDAFVALTKYFQNTLKIDVDFVKNPELVNDVRYLFLVAAWVFAIWKKCLDDADNGNVESSTKAINGGYNGLAERKLNFKSNMAILPDGFMLKDFSEMKTALFPKGFTSAYNNLSHLLEVHDTSKADDTTYLSDSVLQSQIPDEEKSDINTQSVEVNKDGIKVETSTNNNLPETNVAIVKQESPLKDLWKKITGFVFGGGAIDTATEKLGQVQALGFPMDFWKKLLYFALAGAFIYLFYVFYKDIQNKQKTKHLIEANKTANNIVTTIYADQVDELKQKGYTIVTS